MPLPISPVIPGLEDKEIVFGAQQEEYIPLPALKSITGNVMTRWKLTDEEREAITAGADVILTLMTFNHPLTPVHLAIPSCSMDLSELAVQFGFMKSAAPPAIEAPQPEQMAVKEEIAKTRAEFPDMPGVQVMQIAAKRLNRRAKDKECEEGKHWPAEPFQKMPGDTLQHSRCGNCMKHITTDPQDSSYGWRVIEDEPIGGPYEKNI